MSDRCRMCVVAFCLHVWRAYLLAGDVIVQEPISVSTLPLDYLTLVYSSCEYMAPEVRDAFSPRLSACAKHFTIKAHPTRLCLHLGCCWECSETVLIHRAMLLVCLHDTAVTA